LFCWFFVDCFVGCFVGFLLIVLLVVLLAVLLVLLVLFIVLLIVFLFNFGGFIFCFVLAPLTALCLNLDLCFIIFCPLVPPCRHPLANVNGLVLSGVSY
jgi:hypothetical protein